MKLDDFDRLWKARRYKQALALYYDNNRPFWLSQQVALHLERQGKVEEAVRELEHLVAEYKRLGISLPLPNTTELFKIGKFYSSRSPQTACKFLKLHLSGGDQYGVGKPPRNEAAARKLLQVCSSG